MLHAGKRRAPLSKLRAYVGAWVENDTSQVSDKDDSLPILFLYLIVKY